MPDTELAPLLRLLMRAHDALHTADLNMLREPSDGALAQLESTAQLVTEFEAVILDACRCRGIELPVQVDLGEGVFEIQADGCGGLVPLEVQRRHRR